MSLALALAGCAGHTINSPPAATADFYLNPESEMFEPWKDPVSGITSYVLKQQVAPIQQSFYFTNPSITRDGRYLWFYVSFPPAKGWCTDGRMLAVADFQLQSVHWYPETSFRDASPMVDIGNGRVYWCSEYSVYRRDPDPEAKPVLVNSVPGKVHLKRPGAQLATHLSISADGKDFFIDAMFGRDFLVGSLPVHGGDFEMWQHFDRRYNHGVFSPTDPDLAFIAQDSYTDVVTGSRTAIDNRMWLIRRGGKAEPVFPVPDKGRHTHESWAADGKSIWFVDYSQGVCNIDLATRTKKVIWPGKASHAHASSDGRYVVSCVFRSK